MIERIVTGSGRTRKVFDIPCSNDRKKHVSDRLDVGNIIKTNFLFRGGRGFKAAKARGAAAMVAA